ncbi:MAG: hypothetical protein M9894_32465 [Planctomycetes bacterium]|nr:hypothetical protein [Planctomycetota bacterium]
MAKIRVVGRPRGGRCVYCHDALQGAVRHCPGCGAAWHPECGAEVSGRRRCPTLGCAGPPPDAELRRGRRREPLDSSRLAPAEDAPRAPRRRPGALARLGPYARLVASGVVNSLFLAGASAFVLWVATHPLEYWRTMSKGKHGGQNPWPGTLLFSLMFLAMAGVVLWVCGRWLLQLPGVWRELGQLLDETTPVAMRLSIYSTGSGKSRRTYARLVPVEGRGRQDELNLQLDGLLPPWWLSRQDGARVLVYGLPPPGPYVLEFEDGWLALVHPD